MNQIFSKTILFIKSLIILSKLETLFPKEFIGLYRDDGLAVSKLPSPNLDRLRKKVTQIFNDLDLKIKVETGMR